MAAGLDEDGECDGVSTQLTSKDESGAPGEIKKYWYKLVKVPSRRIPGLIRTKNGIMRFKLSLTTRHVHLHCMWEGSGMLLNPFERRCHPVLSRLLSPKRESTLI